MELLDGAPAHEGLAGLELLLGQLPDLAVVHCSGKTRVHSH